MLGAAKGLACGAKGMKERTRKAIEAVDKVLDPVTWLSGVVCLSVAGFCVSTSWGWGTLGACLLATPVVPRLLRWAITRTRRE